MGTRSLTHFIGTDGEAEVTIYRHWDGNPECAGADLLRFLGLDRDGGTYADSRIGDSSYLAARYVTFLSTQVYSDGLSVGICPPGATDWGAEYRYRIDPEGTVTYLDVYEGDEWQPLTKTVVGA